MSNSRNQSQIGWLQNPSFLLLQAQVAGRHLLKYFMSHHGIFPNIFIFLVEIIYDVAKYSMPCHEIFCHITCVICCGINNDLLTLHMDLLTQLLIVASCEGLKSKKIQKYFLSFLVQPMLQISKALIHTIKIHGLSNHTT